MSKSISKILDFMNLSDNEYDDDYEEADDIEEDVEEMPKRQARPQTKAKPLFGRKKATPVIDEDDDMDDIDDDDYEERPVSRRTSSRKSTYSSSRRPSNIVPLQSRAASYNGSEVYVSRPFDFDSCTEISDVILTGRAVVVNFESVTVSEAQRIIDFISGTCYSIKGSMKQIAENIIIVAPAEIDIAGDLENAVTSNVDIPSFGYTETDD